MNVNITNNPNIHIRKDMKIAFVCICICSIVPNMILIHLGNPPKTAQSNLVVPSKKILRHQPQSLLKDPRDNKRFSDKERCTQEYGKDLIE